MEAGSKWLMSLVICIRLSWSCFKPGWKDLYFFGSAFPLTVIAREGSGWKEKGKGAFLAINQPANIPVLCSQ